MSETPFSENDELYPNSIQSPSTDSTSQTDENHTLEDAVESTNDGLVSSEDRPRPKSYLSPSEQSDPPPGFDLCVSPSSASFNKMIDVALMLQAQLTRLAVSISSLLLCSVTVALTQGFYCLILTINYLQQKFFQIVIFN